MDADGETATLTRKDGAEKKKVKKKKPSSKQSGSADPQDNIVATDSIKKSTKATFDLYLEQAQANIERDRKSSPKKGKSKRKKEGEEVLLENLRNSSEFRKDTDEETRKRNTFDPDESKEKSNKKRDRQRKRVTKSGSSKDLINGTEGSENAAFESGEGERASPQAEPADSPMTIDELAKTKKSKKKKSKKTVKEDEEETTFIVQQENISPDDEQKQPKKKKEPKKPKEEPVAAEEEDKPLERLEYTNENKIAGVVIHRADKLKTNFHVQHPLVRVHLVDADTGQHLKKQDKDRPVTSFYETQNRAVSLDSILPIMTQAFSFKDMRTVIPWWDEMLVFNEPFNNLVQQKPNVIMFFEVLDFVSMHRAAKNKYNQNVIKGEEGWHKEAWAFLKLRGVNGKLNVDKQVRLQLYEIPLSRVVSNEVPVYQYWKYCVRRSYPSSIYVTIKSLLPPDVVESAVRSFFPTQEERGTMTLKQIQDALSHSHTKDTTEDAPSNWSKLPGQMCKLPNSMMLSLPAGKMGCLVMAFSHDGRYLACGCHDRTTHPILIYEIPSGQLAATLTGHYNNIYELSWSSADKYILSASSDGTARVWDVDSQKCLKMLPHPTFVYCAKFHPRVSNVIVTGSYDNILRVWHIDGTDIQADLQQELDEHDSYINCVCFEEEGTKLFSADSGGIIKIWNVYVTERATKKGITRDWKLHSTVENEEIKGQRISYLHLHPNGRRLLIQTKDNTIRMLDLRMMTVTQRYIGALNFREIVHSDITVCGTFVFSGSEDGCAYVWNTETGDQVAVYSDLHFTNTVNDVKFHPLDHIVAFSSRGDNHKVQVFKYDFNWVGKEGQSKYTLINKSHLAVDRASVLPSDDEMAAHTREDKSLQIDTKKQRAMKKLETVMAFAQGVDRQRQRHDDVDLPSAPPGTVDMTETWGSTFDMSYAQTNATGLGPTIMSPHARKTGEIEAMRSHLTSQMQYMKKGPTHGWRPGFSSIGSKGDYPPSINLSMPTQNNPGNLTIQGGEDMKPIGEVRALYDYLAQRSDELSFRRNDIISILYKDTEHWWMGMMKNSGAQGFVPSNYVETIGKMEGWGGDRTDSTRKSTTAVVDKGELKFLSGIESDASSGDDLDTSSRRKNRRRRGTREQKQKETADLTSRQPEFDDLLK